MREEWAREVQNLRTIEQRKENEMANRFDPFENEMTERFAEVREEAEREVPTAELGRSSEPDHGVSVRGGTRAEATRPRDGTDDPNV